MKHATRILALLMVLVLCIGSLAACGNKDPEDTTKPQGGPTTPPASGANKWQDVSFEGETLTIEYNNRTSDSLTTAGSENSLRFHITPDEYSSDAVEGAVYERNETVHNTLGLTVQYSYDDSIHNQLMSHYESISAVDDCPIIIASQHYGLVRAEINGLLYNLKEDYGTSSNYFAFEGDDASGWYLDIMNSTTLDNSKLFIASGDFLIDSLRQAYVTFVNVDLFEETFTSKGGINYLYDLIINPSTTDASAAWTYDTMKTLIEHIEPDADDPTNTTWGLYAHNDPRAFFFSSGLDIFEYAEDGTPSYILDDTDGKKTALHNYTDKLVSLLNSPSVYPIRNSNEATSAKALEAFQDGRVLFATDQMLGTLDGSIFLNMSARAAVIPYPKYSVTESYYTMVPDGAISAGIMINSDEEEFTMASAYLQMMTEESAEVVRQYFEVGLQFKNNTLGPKQGAILDIIRDSLTEPLAFLFDNYCSREIPDNTADRLEDTALTIYDILKHSAWGNTNRFSNLWDKYGNAKQEKLLDVVTKFQTMQ